MGREERRVDERRRDERSAARGEWLGVALVSLAAGSSVAGGREVVHDKA